MTRKSDDMHDPTKLSLSESVLYRVNRGSTSNLDMRDPVPPAKAKDTLKTAYMEGFKFSYMSAI